MIELSRPLPFPAVLGETSKVIPGHCHITHQAPFLLESDGFLIVALGLLVLTTVLQDQAEEMRAGRGTCPISSFFLDLKSFVGPFLRADQVVLGVRNSTEVMVCVDDVVPGVPFLSYLQRLK